MFWHDGNPFFHFFKSSIFIICFFSQNIQNYSCYLFWLSRSYNIWGLKKGHADAVDCTIPVSSINFGHPDPYKISTSVFHRAVSMWSPPKVLHIYFLHIGMKMSIEFSLLNHKVVDQLPWQESAKNFRLVLVALSMSCHDEPSLVLLNFH